MNKEPICEYDHICTSGCNNDFDCPCGNEHCCSVSVAQGNCDGTCDDCMSPDLADLTNYELNNR